MLFIFVKRMYSEAWCSVHGVKVARFPGMSEVSGSIAVSGLCFLLIFVLLPHAHEVGVRGNAFVRGEDKNR